MEDYFTVKDSGKRQEFESGMVRDVTEDKIDYSLVLDGPMIKRLAVHLTKGAMKYKKRNWLQAAGQQEYERFRESAVRHFMQWYYGEEGEDHGMAAIFNINGAEYVKEKIDKQKELDFKKEIRKSMMGSRGPRSQATLDTKAFMGNNHSDKNGGILSKEVKENFVKQIEILQRENRAIKAELGLIRDSQDRTYPEIGDQDEDYPQEDYNKLKKACDYPEIQETFPAGLFDFKEDEKQITESVEKEFVYGGIYDEYYQKMWNNQEMSISVSSAPVELNSTYTKCHCGGCDMGGNCV